MPMPAYPSFAIYKSGAQGVYIAWACYPDGKRNAYVYYSKMYNVAKYNKDSVYSIILQHNASCVYKEVYFLCFEQK